MVISSEVRSKLEQAAVYIVKKVAEETISGSYYVDGNDFPKDILKPELFTEHINTIAGMMLEYESVAEADVEDEVISVIIFLNYCHAYEPTSLEVANGEYPDGRTILDPLTKGGRNEPE